MTPTTAPARATQTPAPANTTSKTATKNAAPSRVASDDEILGIAPSSNNDSNTHAGARDAAPGTDARRDGAHAPRSSADDRELTDGTTSPSSSDGRSMLRPYDGASSEPENLRAALVANPELRRAWDDANAYRETIGTPEEARAATALLADLDRMDALFFSRRPEDHAELARAVADLDPVAFASLANAMAGLANSPQSTAASPGFRSGALQGASPSSSVGAQHAAPGAAPPIARQEQEPAAAQIHDAARQSDSSSGPTPAQAEFFHATNAAAVEGVVAAIESQVERLLPEGISKSARSRVVGEIYRELDATLRSNRQLAQQMREAFRGGALDAEHQRAIVSLVTGRARQALPGVAKRVLNEWTSTVVAANHDRRARQRTAERRVDIAGSSGAGNDGHRSMTPRDIDYARLSDSDILNL